MKKMIINNDACWHKWPEEVPELNGREIHSYLVRGIGGLDEKLNYWICQYVKTDGLPEGWYLNGNEFKDPQDGRELLFVDVDELYPIEVEEEEEIPEFFDFCKKFILDEIDEFEGCDVYGADFGLELTEGMNCAGTFTYSSEKAKRYLSKWFLEAEKYFEYEKVNFGERSNPFDNVEVFTVRMVIEGVRTILSRCKFVDDKWNDKFELTAEIITTIKEEVEEQTDDELF